MGINIDYVIMPELRHINLRTESKHDEDSVAVDLKITGRARIGEHGELIQRLLGCNQDEAFRFWLTNTDLEDGPDPAFTGIEEIKCWAHFEGGHDLEIAGLKLRPTKLSKFVFQPRAGYQVDLTFSAAISEIADNHLIKLKNHLTHEVRCKVVADPDLFDGIEAEQTAEEAHV